jgi:DNA-directed RNA polymerase subunit RPC12/RpoP
MSKEFYEYYCTKCKIKTTHDELAHVKCPACQSGRHIRDCGDYEPPVWENFKDDYSWNKP